MRGQKQSLAAAVAADSSASYASQQYASSSDGRPPSQQRSDGLNKLKQLASARLASRTRTPPAGQYAVCLSAVIACEHCWLSG